MKKIIGLALIMGCVAAQAASINWGSTASLYYGTTSVGSKVTGYLVYLGGAGSTWSAVDPVGIANGTVTAPVANTKVSSLSKVAGAVDSGTAPYFVANPPVDGTSVYGVMFVYTSGTDKWYNLGNLYTFDTTDNATYYNQALDTFTWKDSTIASNASTSAQGWTPVPEPATAALALAGLAMLIRRRK